MRIATWNVNSLRARIEKLWWWFERAQPDVLLMQETKLTDSDAPYDEFQRRGYELAHHGQGRWNGVAIASRVGMADVVSNFGQPFEQALAPDPGDEQLSLPLPASVRDPVSLAQPPTAQEPSEARMISAVCGGIRVVSLYAPNGRSVESSFFQAKLRWFEQLLGWLTDVRSTSEALVLGGDFNVAPTDVDVWDPNVSHGGTHVSGPERDALAALLRWGLIDAYRALHSEPERYTWWDYRAGHFQKNFGMRIDHLLVTRSLAERVIWAEIDREARKGKPIPSDHAPLVIDVDSPGTPIDAGWAGAEQRFAARRAR
jgi:exodeoxyribonuclease-3